MQGWPSFMTEPFRLLFRGEVSLSFLWSSNRIRPFDYPARNFLYVEDGKESGRIDEMNQVFQFLHFQSGYHAVKDILIIPKESALSVEAGHRFPHTADDRIRYIIVIISDDEYAFGGIKTCGNRINHAGTDEVGNEGIHGAVPAENETGSSQDEKVEEEDDIPYGEGTSPGHHDSHDFRTICGSTAFDDDSHTDAHDDSAKNGGQERIIRRRRKALQIRGAERQDDDGIYGIDRHPFAQTAITDDEERKVQKYDQYGKWNACQRLDQKGNTCDASVNDVVWNQEQVKSCGVNGCPCCQSYGLLEDFRIIQLNFIAHDFQSSVKKNRGRAAESLLAEEVGFEPTHASLRLAVFKTAPFNHLGTLPCL